MGNSISFKVIYLEKNQGHGNARRVGLEHCSNDLVALMDADDICCPNRFYYQLRAFEEDPSLDVVGGQITEFIGDPTNIIGRRVVPEKHEDIKRFMKKRCPMNQVSVMFKKKAVQDAGGYIDWFCEEDYYLWIRMFEKGYRFANVPHTLVNVRVGDEMSARRGGWRYFESERRIQRLLLKNKHISVFRYLYNVVIRFFGEVLLTSSIRTRLFRKMRNHDQIDNSESGQILNALKSSKAFSVSMCVYDGDNPTHFDESLESIVNQKITPEEIVLIVDGPINASLMHIIYKWTDRLSLVNNSFQ